MASGALVSGWGILTRPGRLFDIATVTSPAETAPGSPLRGPFHVRAPASRRVCRPPTSGRQTGGSSAPPPKTGVRTVAVGVERTAPPRNHGRTGPSPPPGVGSSVICALRGEAIGRRRLGPLTCETFFCEIQRAVAGLEGRLSRADLYVLSWWAGDVRDVCPDGGNPHRSARVLDAVRSRPGVLLCRPRPTVRERPGTVARGRHEAGQTRCDPPHRA